MINIPDNIKGLMSTEVPKEKVMKTQNGIQIPENIAILMQEKQTSDLASQIRENAPETPTEVPKQAQLYTQQREKTPAYLAGLKGSLEDTANTALGLNALAMEKIGLTPPSSVSSKDIFEAASTVSEARSKEYKDSPISYRLGYLTPYLIPAGAAAKGAQMAYKASPLIQGATKYALGGTIGVGILDMLKK